MAHGSKRWIVAVDGRLKKSRRRTVDDYYRGLDHWEAATDPMNYRRKAKQFCPQCKYVAKQVVGSWRDNADTNYLCYKHESLYVAWERHWIKPYPGRHSHRTSWDRSRTWRRYRAQVRDQLTQERYEEIAPFYHRWYW